MYPYSQKEKYLFTFIISSLLRNSHLFIYLCLYVRNYTVFVTIPRAVREEQKCHSSLMFYYTFVFKPDCLYTMQACDISQLTTN